MKDNGILKAIKLAKSTLTKKEYTLIINSFYKMVTCILLTVVIALIMVAVLIFVNIDYGILNTPLAPMLVVMFFIIFMFGIEIPVLRDSVGKKWIDWYHKCK